MLLHRFSNKGRVYAFSLVELLVVIGIAGILMAASVPAWHSYYRHLTAMTVANNVVSDINYVRSYSMKMEGYGAFAYSPSRDSYVVCSGVDDGVDEKSGNPRLVRSRFTNNNTTIYNYVAADGTQTTSGVPSWALGLKSRKLDYPVFLSKSDSGAKSASADIQICFAPGGKIEKTIGPTLKDGACTFYVRVGDYIAIPIKVSEYGKVTLGEEISGNTAGDL